MDRCQLAEQVASCVGALVERHRDQSNDRNEGRKDTDEESEDYPTPDAQDRPGQLRVHQMDDTQMDDTQMVTSHRSLTSVWQQRMMRSVMAFR